VIGFAADSVSPAFLGGPFKKASRRLPTAEK